MNIPVFKTETASRARLFQLVRKKDGTVESIQVHPSRWDEYLAAITSKVPLEERHPDVRELLEIVKGSAS